MIRQWRPRGKAYPYIIWPLIGLIFAGQFYLFTRQAGYAVGWRSVFAWELTRWTLWAVLAPLMISSIRRRPILSWRKARPILIHVLVSVLFSLVHLFLLAISLWLEAKIIDAISTNQSLIALLKSSVSELIRFFQTTFTLDFHIGVLVYWTILLVCQALDSSRRAAQLETQLANAQLEALKMQLHPHFLFNTLNSVTALLHQDVEAADEMIGELGSFLRLTLKNPGGTEVRLQEELNFLKSYLQIEKVRFQDKLTVNFMIDPDTVDAQVPNLILQPIIENAIRHAVAPRKDAGQIDIHAKRDHGRLHIQIMDNGPGISGPNSGPLKEGIGLQNIRARLQKLYGADHVFKLSNRAGGGLKVELEIAFRTEPAISSEPEDSTHE